MTILEALTDAQLFGALPAFRDLSTWRPWLAFLRSVYGLPMDDEDRALFVAHTGREIPRPGGYPEAVCIVGCQSGKTQIAALVGAYEAAQAAIAGRRGLYVPLIAQDQRGAQRTLLGYVREAFAASEVLRGAVVRETADTLELSGAVSLGVYPCRPASVRGIRAACAVVDELAFFIATDGRPTDTEMLRAVRTRLATTAGKLLILSSPYAQAGALWDLHRKHYGREGSDVLVWQASAPEMNPTLPADYLARMEQDDPEAYRSEVLGEFRAGLATLFDPEALEAVVARGIREVLAAEGASYGAHYDASGGRNDAAALAIGHRDGELVAVDLVRRWPAPHNPEAVIAEAAGVLKGYRLSAVQVDRFAGDFPAAAFARHGIAARVCESNTSDNYLALLPMVNAGRVRLLDHPELLRELRGLERRRGTAGKDHVSHRPGAHDDVAAACAGVVALLQPGTVVSCASAPSDVEVYADYSRDRPRMFARWPIAERAVTSE